jgi:hypothetical protein
MGLTQKLGTIPLAIFTDASNNVGIGGSPSGSYKLDVTGTGRFTSGITGANLSLSDTVAITLSATDSRVLGGSSTGRLLLANSGTTTYGIFYGASHATAPNAISLVTDNTERLRITNTGNVRVVGGGDLEIYPASGSSYTALYNDNDNFSIWNNGAERMRITADNNVLFNTTSTSPTNTSSFIFRSGTTAFSGVLILNHATTNNTGAGYFDCYYNTNYIGGIAQNGASNVSFNTSSDYRLKEDLKDFEGLDLVSKLKVYDFKWKTEDSRMYGVIAHELQEVIPYTVSGNKDEVKEDGKIKVQVVDYSKLVPVLVKAIQELSAKVLALENKS